MLDIRPLAASWPQAPLARFLPPPGPPTRARLRDAAGSWWMVSTCWWDGEGLHREVVSFREGGAGRHTSRFCLTGRFLEVRQPPSPPLHPSPLPALPLRGGWHHIDGTRVAMIWAGPARLTLPDPLAVKPHSLVCAAMVLQLEDGGEVRRLWLAEGLGEIALDRDGVRVWWLEGAQRQGQRWLAPTLTPDE